MVPFKETQWRNKRVMKKLKEGTVKRPSHTGFALKTDHEGEGEWWEQGGDQQEHDEHEHGHEHEEHEHDALVSFNAHNINSIPELDEQKRVTSMRQSLFDDDADDDVDHTAHSESKNLHFEHVTEMGRFCVNDHDVVFWMGDLNYRIKKDVEIGRVYDLLDHIINDTDHHNSDEVRERSKR